MTTWRQAIIWINDRCWLSTHMRHKCFFITVLTTRESHRRQPDCFLNSFLWLPTLKNNLCITGPLWGNSPCKSPHKWPVTRKAFPRNDVIKFSDFFYFSLSVDIPSSVCNSTFNPVVMELGETGVLSVDSHGVPTTQRSPCRIKLEGCEACRIRLDISTSHLTPACQRNGTDLPKYPACVAG